MKRNAAESILSNKEIKSSGELRRKLVAAGAVGALALGLSGCGEEKVSAIPEPTPQSTEIVVETPEPIEVTPEPVETPEEPTPEAPSDERESLNYETQFPNPIVDESLLVGLEDEPVFSVRLDKVQPFFEANGVPLLKAEDLNSEDYAQRVVDNFQKRQNLITDTMVAGHADFAIKIGENSLYSDEEAKNWISLPDEYTEGVYAANHLNTTLEVDVMSLDGGYSIEPSFYLEKVTSYAQGQRNPYDNFDHTFWVEADGYIIGEPETLQAIIELHYTDLGDGNYGYVPSLAMGMKNPEVNGDLPYDVAGYEREIIEVK